MDKVKNAKTVQVICYGTLMTGECNHGFCRNAVSIEPCIVTGTLYDTGWGFPAFVPGGITEVKAELVEIPIEDWPAMDRVLLNFFDLKSVIQCCDKTGRRDPCHIRGAPERAYQMTFDFA